VPHTLGFLFESIAPIFILILVGMVLRRTGLVGEEFISTSSRLVFRVALPVMLFQKMAAISRISPELYLGLAGFAGITLIVFWLVWLLLRRMEGPRLGSMVQGSFRGNIAIIGLALIDRTFGAGPSGIAAVFLVGMMPLYNFLAILVLSRCTGRTGAGAFLNVLKEVSRNPLILSILLGIGFGIFRIPLPSGVSASLGYLGQLTLPLALISIGGSLNLKGLWSRKLLWGGASVVKLAVLPLLAWLAADLLSLPREVRIALVMSAACPTAVSSFSMADAMGADAGLAGEIVSATTLFSMGTLPVWTWLLA